MKHYFTRFVILFLAAIVVACENGSSNEDPINNETIISKVEGVWESGNYYLSLSEDKFLTAYVAPNFIDCGACVETNNTITCTNPYFSRKTKYNIISVTSESISLSVDYVDMYGDSHTKELTLYKTTKVPTTESNILVGKAIKYRSSSYSNVTINFTSYYSGSMSSDKSNIEKYPLNLYYVFYDNHCYYQKFNASMGQVPTIGGWNTDEGDGSISVIELIVDKAGIISDFNFVTDQKL